jgi:hypothetical protein
MASLLHIVSLSMSSDNERREDLRKIAKPDIAKETLAVVDTGHYHLESSPTPCQGGGGTGISDIHSHYLLRADVGPPPCTFYIWYILVTCIYIFGKSIFYYIININII